MALLVSAIALALSVIIAGITGAAVPALGQDVQPQAKHAHVKRTKPPKAPFGRLRVAPARLGFRRILFGKTAATEPRTFSIRDTGTGPLTISVGNTATSKFIVTQGAGQTILQPKGSMQVTVLFAPYAQGAFTDSIPITSDATKGRSAVAVGLRGVAKGNPPPIPPTPTPTPVPPTP
ncbi:MAG: hypothetical protein ACREQE_07760, partial [Candidatus Binataceae bacterium]